MSIKQNGGVFGRNPTFHDATIENDLSVSGAFSADTASFTGNVDLGDNDRLRLGAGSDLQIYHDGTRNYIDASSETRLRSSSFTLRDNANYIFFATASNNAGNYSLTMYANDTPSMKFQGGSIVAYENIVFNSAGDGIDFSATSGTGTSELFDDYEEGTWTPTFSAEFTTPPTVTSTQYTKIGRQVTVTMLAVGGVVTAGGSIGGLPFASNAAQGAGAYGGNSDTTESLQGTVGQSASSITNIPARTLTGDTWQITTTYFT